MKTRSKQAAGSRHGMPADVRAKVIDILGDPTVTPILMHYLDLLKKYMKLEARLKAAKVGRG